MLLRWKGGQWSFLHCFMFMWQTRIAFIQDTFRYTFKTSAIFGQRTAIFLSACGDRLREKYVNISLLITLPNNYFLHHSGPRSCAGEQLARSIMESLIIHILHQYNLSGKDGEEVDLSFKAGINLVPNENEVFICPREAIKPLWFVNIPVHLD